MRFISLLLCIIEADILRQRMAMKSVTGVLSLAQFHLYIGTSAKRSSVCLEH